MKKLRWLLLPALCMLVLLGGFKNEGRPAAVQDCTAEGLKAQLGAIKAEKLKAYDLSPSASDELDKMITDAAAALKDKPGSCDEIAGNFRTILDSVIAYKERALGSTEQPDRVTKKSVKKGLNKLCPIYPFCR